MATEIVRHWDAKSKRPCELREAPPFVGPPATGIVVGTYAAVPYIHLQLEARNRFYPKVPLLVHDDCSGRGKELAGLCAEYGVDFESNAGRMPPCVGDLTAIAGGLIWAKEKGIELLLKASRRWVFRTDWAADLQRLAMRSQYATYCSFTTSFNFGFRTECFGMAVHSWANPAIFHELAQPIRERRTVFVEGFVHNLARKLETLQSNTAERWRHDHPMPPARSGYALWGLMGTDRRAPSESYLWHDCDGPADYHRASLEWGLPYREADFADPNQGEGNGVTRQH